MERSRGESAAEEPRVQFPDRCDCEGLLNHALTSGGDARQKITTEYELQRINDIICDNYLGVLCLLSGRHP